MRIRLSRRLGRRGTDILEAEGLPDAHLPEHRNPIREGEKETPTCSCAAKQAK